MAQAAKKSTPSRGGRPKQGDAEKIAGRIVAAARDLFFEHGYGATSIERIAQKARISKRTFYARFTDKAAIFHAVAGGLIESVTPPHVEDLFEGMTLAEIFHKLAEALLHASLSPQALALHRLMVAEATRFPELALIMNEQPARRMALARIGGLLKREAEAGRLAVKDPTLAAELFMNMVSGLPQRRALGLGKPMSEAELKAWGDQAVALFLHGLSKT